MGALHQSDKHRCKITESGICIGFTCFAKITIFSVYVWCSISVCAQAYCAPTLTDEPNYKE